MSGLKAPPLHMTREDPTKRGMWSQLSESNRRPSAYKAEALPTELSWPQQSFAS